MNHNESNRIKSSPSQVEERESIKEGGEGRGDARPMALGHGRPHSVVYEDLRRYVVGTLIVATLHQQVLPVVSTLARILVEYLLYFTTE